MTCSLPWLLQERNRFGGTSPWRTTEVSVCSSRMMAPQVASPSVKIKTGVLIFMGPSVLGWMASREERVKDLSFSKAGVLKQGA